MESSTKKMSQVLHIEGITSRCSLSSERKVIWYSVPILRSRPIELHYLRKEWTCRENVAVGQKNIQYPALVEADKILLALFCIKLGLMKNFVKAMDWTSPAAFRYLHEKFSRLSEAKIKEGVLVGPQV